MDRVCRPSRTRVLAGSGALNFVGARTRVSVGRAEEVVTTAGSQTLRRWTASKMTDSLGGLGLE